MNGYWIEFTRAMLLGAFLLVVLQWGLNDWMASIEARLWFLSIIGEF